MTKKIHTSYAILGMILVASACSQEDVKRSANRENGGRIEFKASFPEVSSRATEVKEASLHDIQVSAFKVGASSETLYFCNKVFSRNSDAKFVSYDPECVWPNNKDLLRFAAFAPSCKAMEEAGGAATSTGDKLDGFKVAQDIASQFDFVTAISTGRLLDDEEKGIDLKFQHQLSRIQLKAWGNSKSYDIDIAGVRLGGVGTGGTFSFAAQSGASDAAPAGIWESVSKGYVEYIFRNGDAIVTLDKSEGSPLSPEKAVSIMGSKIVDGENSYENSAMIIPSYNFAWDYNANSANGENHADGMYFSVLLRVKDMTVNDTKGRIVYPYADSADNMEVVYLAVNNGIVKRRLYKQGDDYFTDSSFSVKYISDNDSEEIKTFCWAALPVEDNLKPGRVYTYILNYSNGVGVHDPHGSRPGDPIISDKVLVNVTVSDWIEETNSDVRVPRK